MDWSLGLFGDIRLDKIGATILERMAVCKTVCLRRLGGSRSGELRIGRFFASEKVTAEKIVADWGRLTGPASAGRHVLAIQDTCEVKFPTTAQRRRDLGPVKKGNAYGVLVHAMIAVDAPTGACLGLVGGEVWTRDGVVETDHRDRPLSERESKRWLATAEQAKTVLRSAAMVTVVGDREADIYAKWASVPGQNFHVLTRAMNDRRLAGGGLLFATMATFPVVGQRTIELPAREPGRAARTAKLELRFGTVEIARPSSEWDRSLAKTVTLRAIDVREIDTPPGIEPLHWRLLTTHAIADAAAASAQRLAVQRDAALSRRCACCLQLCRVATEDRLHRDRIKPLQDVADGGVRRRTSPFQAEYLIQSAAVHVDEGDDAAVGVAAGHEGEDGKQQHIRQLVELALRPARVGNLCQQVQQRRECSHGNLLLGCRPRSQTSADSRIRLDSNGFTLPPGCCRSDSLWPVTSVEQP